MPDNQFSEPDEVELAFYKAFETSDLDAMMQVWLDADYIECIHPMSHRLMGVHAIRESWQEIFNNNADVEFETVDTRRIKHKDLAIHIVNENLLVNGEKRVQVLATNIYEKTPDGWRMILHHASPAPKPEKPSTLH
ncbi:MAG: nuclear transport factor 2 family protein [Gammaproteobacteria bacterium]|nr:nuclear transport factor 2 family protein [Gammaproteobacteria bacterium]